MIRNLIHRISRLLLAILFMATAASAQQFQLTGRVRDADTGRPLPQVWLGLYTAHSLLGFSVTNHEGRFEMKPVERDLGTYFLEIRSDETDRYPIQHREIEIDRWDEIRVEIELHRVGFGPFSLEGRVLEEGTGEPVEGVWLGLYRGSELVARTFTNPGGEYKLPHRGEFGAYRVEIKPVLRPFRERRTPVEIRQSGVMQKDFFVQSQPTGAALPQPEIAFDLEGRLFIGDTGRPVPESTVSLLRGRQKIGTDFSEPDGRFRLEVVGVRPGEYLLEVDAWSLALEDIQVPIRLEGRNLRNLEIEVPGRFDSGVTQADLTGEVFAAGGGRGLGWVAVYLMYRNNPLVRVWTNDFGRYEMRQVIVPRDRCQLVFFPEQRAFFPVVREVDFSRTTYHSISVSLPALALTPTVRQQASGRIENRFPGGPGPLKWTLLDGPFPAFRAQTRGEYYFWEGDLPQKSYLLQLVSRSGLEISREPGFLVAGERLTERVEQLDWSRTAWMGGVGGLALILAVGAGWLGIQKRLERN